MKRIAIVVTAFGLLAGACGSDDSDESTPAPVEADAATGDAEPDDAVADEPSDADEASADGESETTETTDTTAAANQGDDDESDAASGRTISSIDDIPRVCRELMADFLREIEPTVSPIDWQSASLADLESIGPELEARSEEFDTAGEADGCNDLDFVGDSEFELMIDFARTEAPGTVGFLEFTAGFIEPVVTDDGGDGDDGGSAGGFESCDDAIVFVEGLIADHDTVADVPAADLIRFQDLATVMMTCSPEQISFFDSPEITDFFGG